ncbi:uncharacterized protein LOC144432853 isoform X1 [Glandiceps talaboti]
MVMYLHNGCGACNYVHSSTQPHLIHSLKECLNVYIIFNPFIDCTDKYLFQCDNGKCTSVFNRCNSYRNCDDGSDELNCPDCPGFECDNGYCISLWTLCNGYEDCSDGSDEGKLCEDCTDELLFKCENGKCTSAVTRCDTYQDCDDGSDEMNCSE